MMSKKVSFSHINIAAYESPSTEEKAKRWFSNDDFCSFQDDRRACIKAINLVDGDLNQLDNSIYCIRGLEDKVSAQHYREKNCKRAAIIRIILKTYQEQKEQRHPDAENLKMISMMCSKMSRDHALYLAQLDEVSCGLRTIHTGGRKRGCETQSTPSLPFKRRVQLEC
jgi:hypothetical protein